MKIKQETFFKILIGIMVLLILIQIASLFLPWVHYVDDDSPKDDRKFNYSGQLWFLWKGFVMIYVIPAISVVIWIGLTLLSFRKRYKPRYFFLITLAIISTIIAVGLYYRFAFKNWGEDDFLIFWTDSLAVKKAGPGDTGAWGAVGFGIGFYLYQLTQIGLIINYIIISKQIVRSKRNDIEDVEKKEKKKGANK